MDPMTAMAALKFLQGGGLKKVAGALGGKLGLSPEQAEGLGEAVGGGDAAAGPGQSVQLALALLAEHAPLTDAAALEAYVDGVASAIRGVAAVRSLAA